MRIGPGLGLKSEIWLNLGLGLGLGWGWGEVSVSVHLREVQRRQGGVQVLVCPRAEWLRVQSTIFSRKRLGGISNNQALRS